MKKTIIFLMVAALVFHEPCLDGHLISVPADNVDFVAPVRAESRHALDVAQRVGLLPRLLHLPGKFGLGLAEFHTAVGGPGRPSRTGLEPRNGTYRSPVRAL